MEIWILVVAFFVIALIYASVGFGGGTSYLALMGVMNVAFGVMRPAALLCNIVVVIGGTWVFYRNGLLDWRRFWPFLVSAIPMSYLGGNWPIKENTFFQILGSALIIAALLLWFQDRFAAEDKPVNPDRLGLNLVLGAGIGFLSGLVSIGGGIFLAPLLHLMRWDKARKISALASLFILTNSVSGLIGQLRGNATLDWEFVAPLLIAVLIGGQIGSRLGATRFNAAYIRKITAVLILVAGINILLTH